MGVKTGVTQTFAGLSRQPQAGARAVTSDYLTFAAGTTALVERSAGTFECSQRYLGLSEAMIDCPSVALMTEMVPYSALDAAYVDPTTLVPLSLGERAALDPVPDFAQIQFSIDADTTPGTNACVLPDDDPGGGPFYGGCAPNVVGGLTARVTWLGGTHTLSDSGDGNCEVEFNGFLTTAATYEGAPGNPDTDTLIPWEALAGDPGVSLGATGDTVNTLYLRHTRIFVTPFYRSVEDESDEDASLAAEAVPGGIVRLR